MDKLFIKAENQLGQKEIIGPEENPTTVNYAKASGFGWVDDDETPWCNIFLNWCAARVGLEKSSKANARSLQLIGDKIENPESGDIVVLWRGAMDSWQGHAGILFGFSKNSKRIYILGRIQGNQISIAGFPIVRILGYRRLRPANPINLPDITLKMGLKGQDVKTLQDALKILGFDCGTSDGSYSLRTAKAVRERQATNNKQTIDGDFERDTRAYLLEILNPQ